MSLDHDVLARILAQLAPADAAWLSARLEPAWQSRQRRLDCRDRIVQRVLGEAEGAPLTLAAAAFIRRLHRAASCPSCDDADARLFLSLNRGQPLSIEQLRRIVRDGRRTPELPCINSTRNAQPPPSDSAHDDDA